MSGYLGVELVVVVAALPMTDRPRVEDMLHLSGMNARVRTWGLEKLSLPGALSTQRQDCHL
jgi:hypothetical protein